jgi:hypothetical protein
MWEDIKPLLTELFNVAGKVWNAIKWLAEWIGAVAVWLFKVLVLYCKLVYGLFTGHLYALAAMVIVLVIGYLIVNFLQKRKSFVEIPWYKEPRNQSFILVPIITTFLAISTNTKMVDVSGGGRFFFEIFGHSSWLGPVGHLGVPTTIWALIFSFIFVVVAGSIALTKTEQRKRKWRKMVKPKQVEPKKEEAEESPKEQVENGEEAVILNEQPGWYEERKNQPGDEEESGE